MEAYAVVEAGGKQYRVKAGDRLKIERIEAEVGQDVPLGRVLAVSNGQSLNVGHPEVAGASVQAKVVEHVRGPKLIAYKKKRRQGYERKIGHRQDLTVVVVGAIA